MRKRFIRSHLGLVDRFIAPSRFLRDRYVDWGIPRREDPRRGLWPPARTRAWGPGDRPHRKRLAFFGQLSHYKGVARSAPAMKRLVARGVDASLTIHGANLELQPQDFLDDFQSLLAGHRGAGHLRRRLRGGGPAGAAGAGRLRRRPVDLVGELATRDPGGLPPRPPGDLQRYRRHGGEGDRRDPRAAFPGEATRTASPTPIERAVGCPGLWETLRDGIEGAHADGRARGTAVRPL